MKSKTIFNEMISLYNEITNDDFELNVNKVNKEEFVNLFSSILENEFEMPLFNPEKIKLNSKNIMIAKMQLDINDEIEKVVILDFFNRIFGKMYSESIKTNNIFKSLEKEYNNMNNTYKNIINVLYEASGSNISHGDLAKCLSLSPSTITKNSKLYLGNHFVKIYKLNQRVVYYSLFDEAREYLEKNLYLIKEKIINYI